MAPFEIRRSLPSDAPAVGEIIQELAIFERMPEGPEIGVDQLAADFADGSAHCYIATSCPSGEPAGMIIYYYGRCLVRGRYIHLEDLYVREQFRRQGLAQMLIRHLAGIAIREGVKTIRWDVLDWNTPARELYAKIGATNRTESVGELKYRLEEGAIEKLAS